MGIIQGPNTCSSLPLMARFHRACRELANQNMTAGPVAFGAGAILKGPAKQSADAGNAARSEGNGLTGSSADGRRLPPPRRQDQRSTARCTTIAAINIAISRLLESSRTKFGGTDQRG
jgi:hypothetical protein